MHALIAERNLAKRVHLRGSSLASRVWGLEAFIGHPELIATFLILLPVSTPERPPADGKSIGGTISSNFPTALDVVPRDSFPTIKFLPIGEYKRLENRMHQEGNFIDVQVTHSSGARNYQIDARRAFAASGYFARRRDEAALGAPIHLHVKDVQLFEMFHTWILKLGTGKALGDDEYLQEPWLSKTAAAWVFAHELEAISFSFFCLSQFIKNCSLAPFGPWEYIEKNTKAGSPLRRFSNHRVAWNASMLIGIQHEYVGLEAATLADLVDEYTEDPREYEEVHWYADTCGDLLTSRCDHNPRIIKERAFLASVPQRPLPRDYGRFTEEIGKRVAREAL